ncbi:MAG: ATP-binding domain-containing protein [Myxococcota bacterium]
MVADGLSRGGARGAANADETPEAGSGDAERERVVAEEEKVLARVNRTLSARRTDRRGPGIDYDAELLALRDQIRTARLEDIPPLVEEMERMQQVAARRAKVVDSMVDASSPYFGRLVLEENERKREVLIGRATFLDSKTGVRIVDWRDAPVSRIYYRYEEGDDYEEQFGDRDVEGDVLVRRSLSIGQAVLKRIASPQGTFVRKSDGSWLRAGASATTLSGGQGAAMRPEKHSKPGTLGTGEGDNGEDKSLGEVTALIDARQFELISRPTSGLVVIQGGAGSGKTTIGLHRLAYLAFQDKRRFRGDRVMVLVFNDALVRYISRVLPALGVEDVPVTTYERWASKLRIRAVPHLPKAYAEDTPSVVTRLKKHPVMLKLIDAYADDVAAEVEEAVTSTGKTLEGGGRALRVWRASAGEAPGRRTAELLGWLRSGEGKKLPNRTRLAIERACERSGVRAEDIVDAWGELLTSLPRLEAAFAAHAPDAFTQRELEWVHAWCARRIPAAQNWREEELERIADGESRRAPTTEGVDGADEHEIPALDREDDAVLLRLHQRLKGPLPGRSRKDRLAYEHVFVDETQDLSPLELAVVLDTTTKQRSVTLAGDTAQKLYMENGFSDWKSVLGDLGLDHVQIEPLRLSYRSTVEIMELANAVLGPLKKEDGGRAVRHGAPVELFRFTGSGEAVAFLSEALRNLARSEPLASVAVISRYPEQADLYFKGLKRGEVPNLRRIADQDFPFRPGVDVTDVRQVKGLEFDYVVCVDTNSSTYPIEDEARHLLHIATTRAAHQLWIVSTGSPSMLLPESLRSQV